MLSKQDQAGARTPEDVLRRLNLHELEEALEVVDKIRKNLYVDTQLSITSTMPVENKVITQALNQKVNKVEGKGLSTNDFTNEYKSKLDTEIIDLSNYAVSGLQITNVTCINKNNRVCIDFTGVIDIQANTQTTIFTIPSSIVPTVNKNFLCIANNIVGVGTITSTGNITLTFPQTISDKVIKYSAIYDLEEVEE